MQTLSKTGAPPEEDDFTTCAAEVTELRKPRHVVQSSTNPPLRGIHNTMLKKVGARCT